MPGGLFNLKEIKLKLKNGMIMVFISSRHKTHKDCLLISLITGGAIIPAMLTFLRKSQVNIFAININNIAESFILSSINLLHNNMYVLFNAIWSRQFGE
jgi:hypothetical protein